MTTMLGHGDPEGFVALRDRAAEDLGVAPGAVEKDYWGTEVLRSVGQPTDGVSAVVFKGGTSLSKAFGIIERFSEDIDVIVVLSGEPSGNRLKSTLRNLAARAGQVVGLSMEREREGRGYLNARYSYPATASAAFLSPGVLLEMGSRGGPAPNERRVVRSFMSQTAERLDPSSLEDHPDLRPFEVTVLAPERTLAEKLAFLHHRASIGDEAAMVAGARHLYDVAMILRRADIRDRLRGDALARLMEDVDRRSEAAGWGYTARPEGGFSNSPAFASSGTTADALRRGYEQVRPLVWGEMPTFDEALDTVHDHRDFL